MKNARAQILRTKFRHHLAVTSCPHLACAHLILNEFMPLSTLNAGCYE